MFSTQHIYFYFTFYLQCIRVLQRNRSIWPSMCWKILTHTEDNLQSPPLQRLISSRHILIATPSENVSSGHHMAQSSWRVKLTITYRYTEGVPHPTMHGEIPCTCHAASTNGNTLHNYSTLSPCITIVHCQKQEMDRGTFHGAYSDLISFASTPCSL